MSFFIVACLPLKAARLGDPAAALAIKDWIKGSPVELTTGTNIYVVEFWATWCGPCKMTIPRLSEMQAKYKDKGVIFIGISDEPAEVVKPFVAEMGAQMSYTVACDAERRTATNYTEAYGQYSIPVAFIVGKDRKILWYGHPLAEMEPTLQNILNGTYDLKLAMRQEAERAAWSEYMQSSMLGEARAPELGKKFLNSMPQTLDALVSFAFLIVANQQNPHRDFALAMMALDRAEKAVGGGAKHPLVLGVRGITIFEAGGRNQGLAMTREAVTLSRDPQTLPMLQHFVRVMEYAIQIRAQGGPVPGPTASSATVTVTPTPTPTPAPAAPGIPAPVTPAPPSSPIQPGGARPAPPLPAVTAPAQPSSSVAPRPMVPPNTLPPK